MRQPCERSQFTIYDNSGDQAGSEAKLGVGTLSSFRPPTSMVNSEGPALPPGSRKNMITRPFGAKVGKVRLRTIRPYPTDRVKDVLSKFKVVGVIETNMGLGSVSSGGVLYGEVTAALYESQQRPRVMSFMAGMGGEAIVLKEFYWMTEKMLDAQRRGKIEKRTHWVGFEE